MQDELSGETPRLPATELRWRQENIRHEEVFDMSGNDTSFLPDLILMDAPLQAPSQECANKDKNLTICRSTESSKEPAPARNQGDRN